jgi:hypothetical protein
MEARHPNGDRLASVLLWTGRSIAGAWAFLFLLSLAAEVASGYAPGGSVFTSALSFALGGLMVVGTLVALLPGLLLVAAAMIQHQSRHAEADAPAIG